MCSFKEYSSEKDINLCRTTKTKKPLGVDYVHYSISREVSLFSGNFL